MICEGQSRMEAIFHGLHTRTPMGSARRLWRRLSKNAFLQRRGYCLLNGVLVGRHGEIPLESSHQWISPVIMPAAACAEQTILVAGSAGAFGKFAASRQLR